MGLSSFERETFFETTSSWASPNYLCRSYFAVTIGKLSHLFCNPWLDLDKTLKIACWMVRNASSTPPFKIEDVTDANEEGSCAASTYKPLGSVQKKPLQNHSFCSMFLVPIGCFK